MADSNQVNLGRGLVRRDDVDGSVSEKSCDDALIHLHVHDAIEFKLIGLLGNQSCRYKKTLARDSVSARSHFYPDINKDEQSDNDDYQQDADNNLPKKCPEDWLKFKHRLFFVRGS